MTPAAYQAAVRGQQGGVLLDTGVLLLYLIAEADPAAARSWKRTRQFTELHVAFLRAGIALARRLVTTPHVLTEVMNLSDGVPVRVRGRYFDGLRAFIATARERCPSALTASTDPEFASLGLADVAQAWLPNRGRPLVLTVDAGLFASLERRRLPVVNLNHLAFPTAR